MCIYVYVVYVCVYMCMCVHIYIYVCEQGPGYDLATPLESLPALPRAREPLSPEAL